MLIDMKHPRLSVTRQCELLGLPRSSLYYRSRGRGCLQPGVDASGSTGSTRQTPFYRRAADDGVLTRDGQAVNDKRVRRLMRVMGLEAIYPKPRTSLKNQANPVYPYLLKGW